MMMTRTSEQISNEFRYLITVLDELTKHMEKKSYEFTDSFSSILDKKVLSAASIIQDVKHKAASSLIHSVQSDKAQNLVGMNLKKWSKENNQYFEEPKTRLGSILSDFVIATNYLRFELALGEIFTANGNLDVAKTKLSKNDHYGKHQDRNGEYIFNSAAMLAKVDGIKISQSKSK